MVSLKVICSQAEKQKSLHIYGPLALRDGRSVQKLFGFESFKKTIHTKLYVFEFGNMNKRISLPKQQDVPVAPVIQLFDLGRQRLEELSVANKTLVAFSVVLDGGRRNIGR